MSAPIPLRRDFDASQLRSLAKKTKDGPQARRLLALAAIYDGAARTEAAKIGGIGLQIIRDWVLHFNERGPGGLPERQVAGPAVQAQRRPAPGDRPHHREWPNSGSARRGPLAADRSGTMDLRGIPHHDRQADAQPGAARHGLPQGSRPGRATTLKPRARSRILKKFPHASGDNRARKSARLPNDRNLVRRRSARWPKEQDHATVGQARYPSHRAA